MTDIGETGMARLALLGLPQDDNSTFLRGPALAPPLIRQALVSPSANMFAETGTDLGVAGLWQDAGDLPLSGLSGQAAHDAIHDGVSAVLARGQAVISLGGDHSVTWPAVRAKMGGLTMRGRSASLGSAINWRNGRYFRKCS